MKIINKLQEHTLYRLISTLLLASVCLYVLGFLAGIREIRISHLLIMLFTVCVLTALSYFRARGRFLLGIGFSTVCIMSVLFIGIDSTTDILLSYFRWLTATAGWQAQYLWAYELINTALLTFLCFCFQLTGEKYFLLKHLAGLSLLLCLIGFMIAKHSLSHIGMTLSLTYLALLYAENRQRKGKHLTSCGNRSSIILWLTPFLAVYSVLLFLMPVPQKAFDWQFAKNLYSMLRETVMITTQNLARFGKSDDFHVAFAGFSENGNLFGNIFDNNKEIMQVSTSMETKTNIYLTGKIFNEFDGSEWIQTDTSSELDREADTMETLYAVKRYAPSNQSDYLYQNHLRIKYLFFDTAYLFAPLKSWKVLTPAEVSSQGCSMVFDKKKGYGTEYDVMYMQTNLNHPAFYELLQEQQGYQYEQKTPEGEKNRKLLQALAALYSTTFTEAYFNKRAAHINSLYNIPVYLSQEVQDYLQSITAGAASDIEKCQAIEQALSQMTYTQTPGMLPADKDFLDYFLLESKEGYCSYYATAFVLLARAEGIPARYVQGFCIPANKNKEAIVTVYSGMAHAWPEVYIAGVGWIPFEPTPGYGTLRYTPWSMSSAAGSASALPPYTAIGEADIIPPLEDTQPAEEIPAEKTPSRLPSMLCYTILFMTLACICFFLLDMAYSKRKYRRMPPESKLRLEIMSSMNILAVLGFLIQEGETLHELRIRVQDKYAPSSLPLAFLMIYEEVLYSDCLINDAMIEKVRREKRELLSVLKENTGKKYVLYRIRLYFMKSRSYS